MSNLLSGLGKYGLDEGVADNLFQEKQRKRDDGSMNTEESSQPKEEDFLLLKTVECPICDKKFRTIAVKTGRVRRKEPDLDLRPRFEVIDTNKYDVASCPYCGFTALHRYFKRMGRVQMNLVKEGVCDKLKTPPTKEITEIRTYTYDEAIELLKLALYTTIVKKGANSEKAYECLKISWLLWGKIEELAVDKQKNKAAILEAHKEYADFYKQAFDGLTKAMSSENYPICGMEQNTLDLLLAAMAFKLGNYDFASRMVSGLLVSRTASGNIKNRAYDLKEKIMAKVKDGKK